MYCKYMGHGGHRLKANHIHTYSPNGLKKTFFTNHQDFYQTNVNHMLSCLSITVLYAGTAYDVTKLHALIKTTKVP